MLRHPENPNLHLHYNDTFHGLPVMSDKGPFVRQYLSRLERTIQHTLDQYSRVLAFRVDLRLPLHIELLDDAYTNDVISRCIESFKAKIKHDRGKARERNPYAHDCLVRYAWAREIGRGERPHYHLLILLNRNAYYTIGRLRSNVDSMISRMEAAWASALELSVDQVAGLVEIPKNATYRVDRGDRDGLSDLFHRASYLCKVATKRFGEGCHGFGCSRG